MKISSKLKDILNSKEMEECLSRNDVSEAINIIFKSSGRQAEDLIYEFKDLLDNLNISYGEGILKIDKSVVKAQNILYFDFDFSTYKNAKVVDDMAFSRLDAQMSPIYFPDSIEKISGNSFMSLDASETYIEIPIKSLKVIEEGAFDPVDGDVHIIDNNNDVSIYSLPEELDELIDRLRFENIKMD